MRVVAIDDEKSMLDRFKCTCMKYEDIYIDAMFDQPLEAIGYLKRHQVDAVFVDIEMPGMSGIELAKMIRRFWPKVILIFMSGREDYVIDALRLKIDGYLLKPYADKDLCDVIEKVRLLSARIEKRIYIQCFGKFQIFVEGKPLMFRSQKAKELMAVLVDKRGAIVPPQEVFGLMWEDKPYSNYTGSAYRKALVKLRDILEENRCEEILIRTPMGCAINKNVVECDYYKYLEEGGNGIVVGYMDDYSWGEYTLASLTFEEAWEA